MSSNRVVEAEYKAFRYPPDYSLARLHQNATMPGKAKPTGEKCPCCK